MISDLYTPNGNVSRRYRQYIVLGWLLVVILLWTFSPFVFLPTPAETWASFNDLWFYQNLGQALGASVMLNIEAVLTATIISLLLAYAATLPVFRPVAIFVGELRFLSFYGLAFAFVLMIHNGQALKVTVLAFMVTVFFVVSMLDVIASIPREQYDLATTLRMGPWRRLWEVVVLGQVDQVFIVMRQTAAMSWMTVATAEAMSRAGGGVGVLLANNNKQLNLAGIMALQLIVLLLGLGQDWLIEHGRKEFCRYAYLGKGASR